METKFASPERTSQQDILLFNEQLNKVPLVREVMDHSTEVMFVLDSNRQVVFANKAYLDFLRLDSFDSVIGKRPGEALGCIHSENISGCGTTEYCIKCGAVNAILEAQLCDKEVVDECLLIDNGGKAFEFMIIAKKFDFCDRDFTFFTAKDISDSKRKASFERVFLHDIMNLASGIYSVMDLIKDGNIKDVPDDMFMLLHQSSGSMIKEIGDYRTFAMAENRELTIVPDILNSNGVLGELLTLYSCYAEKRGVELVIREGSESVEFICDKSVLSRVLSAMIKNAVEASVSGDLITMWAESSDGQLRFSVHNPSAMPEDVQLQVFKRAFTTKRSAAGLGTYSMKLLGESYLSGEVTFSSDEDSGTIFTISLPKQ